MLPIGWKNSPLVFSTAIETAADIRNTSLTINKLIPSYLLESYATVYDQDPASIPIEYTTTAISYILAPTLHNPCLPTSRHSKLYIDVFIDNFIAIYEGNHNKFCVRRVLLHTVDSILRSKDFYNSVHHRKPVLIKKLH